MGVGIPHTKHSNYPPHNQAIHHSHTSGVTAIIDLFAAKIDAYCNRSQHYGKFPNYLSAGCRLKGVSYDQ